MLNLQDLLLAQGNGTAEQNNSIHDDSLEGKGRLSAYAIVHSEALGVATASAVSKNKLSATYRVSSPVRFTLSGSLAGAGEFSLGVSLVDQFGVSLYSFNPTMAANGRSWAFGLSGILRPGDYTIAVAGEAHNGNNSIFPLDTYKGGMGEYTLSFHATPIMAGDFDNNGVVSGSDLGRWRSDFGMGASGEADFDGDSDGADFLAWQRLLGTHTSGATAAIPEPCAGVLALASALWMAALRRRT